MSLQPPGGGQEGGAGYSQPQDPWSGFEPGLASMPTDPIPHRQPETYGPTVPDAVWTSPTVLQGQPVSPQFPYPPPPRRGNAGLISMIVVLILVLGGGGGYEAYHYIKTHHVSGAQSPPPSSSGSAGTDTAPPAVFPYTAKAGDCVANVGSEQKPKMAPSPCTTPNSYKIVKIARGSSIPLGPGGTFDTNTTSAAVCAGIQFDTWYGYQVDNPDLNVFFCMTNN
jgi:hypothetical protein